MSINWNEWTYPSSPKYILPVMKCWYVNDAIWKFTWGWKGVITEVSAQESHIVKYRVVWSIVINLSSTFIYTHCDTINTTTISSWCLDWHWIIAVISEETMNKLRAKWIPRQEHTDRVEHNLHVYLLYLLSGIDKVNICVRWFSCT